MEGPISFWGYKEQELNLILPEHDDDDDEEQSCFKGFFFYLSTNHTKHKCTSAFRKYKVIRVAKMRRWKFAAIMHVSERGDYFV